MALMSAVSQDCGYAVNLLAFSDLCEWELLLTPSRAEKRNRRSRRENRTETGANLQLSKRNCL
jgi:hypothetical protein